MASYDWSNGGSVDVFLTWEYGFTYRELMLFWGMGMELNIRCMLDSIIGFGHKTAEMHFFSMSAQLVSAQNEMLLWLAGMNY